MHKKLFSGLLIVVLSLTVLSLTSAQAQDTVTLRVWDTHTEENENAGMEAFIEAFEAEYPNIKIERDVQATDDMRPVIRTALASGTGPDVFYYDTGPGFAGVLAEAGLLLPLTEAYATMGWDHIYEWTLGRTTFNGEVYGVSNELEFYGAYYNMDLFAELGLEIPETQEAFMDLLETIKGEGYIPISFANQGGWPAYHMFSIYANNYAGKEKIEDLLFGDASWDDPDIIAAIQMFFVNMNEAGYFVPFPNAVAYGDGAALFTSGQTAMHLTGSWYLDTILHDSDFNVGWFWVPAPAGKETLPPAGIGSGYFVSASTEHPDEALLFIDFLFDPANAKYWLEDMAMIPPFPVNADDYALPDLQKFAIEALTTVTMGENIDVVTPDNFNKVMADGFQAVLLGEKTAEQQAADLEAAMEEYRSSN